MNRPMRTGARRRTAFTLIELFVILGSIAVLLGLLLPALHKVGTPCSRSMCANNLRQIGLATYNCNDIHGYLPQFGYPWPKDSTTLRQASPFWAILPLMEQEDLYKSLPAGQTSSAYFSPSSRRARVSAFLCPSDHSGIRPDGVGPGWNLSSYNVNGQVFVGLGYPVLDRTFTDGTSNTALYVEHLALCRGATSARSVWPGVNLTTSDAIVYWPGATNNAIPADFPGFGIAYPDAQTPDPNNGNVLSWKVPQARPKLGARGTCDPTTGSGGHSTGVMVCLADGSTRLVSAAIAQSVWNAVLTPAGGERLTPDW